MMNLTQSQIDIFNDIGKKYFINYNISIDVSNGLVVELDAENIIQESVSIKQSINEQSKLAFGGCISSYFSVSVAGANDYAIDGKKMTVTANIEDADENTVYSYSVGEFYIDSSPLSSNKLYRNITAYDCLYTKGNKNGSEYYEGLFTNSESVNLGTFITGLLTYAGIPTNNLNISTNILIYHGVSMQGSEVTVNTLLRMALELLGKYGYIDSDGYFNVIDISSNVSHAIDDYISFDKSEKPYDGVTGVRIQLSSTDEGTLVGQTGNVYDVTSNYLTYGMSSQEITAIGQSLRTTLQSYLFTPCIVETYNTLYLELGDVISVTDEENVTFYSPILSREINGIVVSKDKLSSNVEHDYNTETYSEANEVKALKGKTLELVKTVDEVSSRMTDIENNTSSAIVQTANTITMNVKRGNDTVSIVLGEVDENNNLVLSAEAKDILLTADNIKIVSNNFNVDEQGNVQIKGSNALLQVRDNETFVDISAGEKMIDMYKSPIVVSSYSTLAEDNPFVSFSQSFYKKIIKVDNYLYTILGDKLVKSENLETADMSNLQWDIPNLGHFDDEYEYDVCELHSVCHFNNEVCVCGKYTNSSTNQSANFLSLNESEFYITQNVSDYSDIVAIGNTIFWVCGNGLYYYRTTTDELTKITDYDYIVSDKVKLKAFEDFLFVIDGKLSVFYCPFHLSTPQTMTIRQYLTLNHSAIIQDIEILGHSTYVLLSDNNYLWYANSIYDVFNGQFYEGFNNEDDITGEFSSIRHFDFLLNIGESVIAVGRTNEDWFGFYETCNGKEYSSLTETTDIYDYQEDNFNGVIVGNYIITPKYSFKIDNFISFTNSEKTNIFSIKKSGEMQYDGKEFDFGETSDDGWNTTLKIKKDVITSQEEHEYSIEFKTINNTDDITRKLNLSCFNGIRFSEEENGTETKRFRIDEYYFECFDEENDNHFILSNSRLNLKNGRGVGINLETDGTLNGEDDEGLKITPSENCYCGIDAPFVNDYDMHMSLYTHTNQSGASQNIPSIKVEQRDNTGTRNEVYLLNGDGDTLFPNDVFVGGTLSQSSDRKAKDNIETINEKSAIDLINSLQPVQYTFKKDENKRLNMGFVAQDVKEVCDNIGIDNFALYNVSQVDKKGNRSKKVNLKKGVSDEELSWGLSYTQLIAPMVATIQNLTKRVEELEQKLNDKTSK